MSYRVVTQRVAAETLDHEVVILDQVSGTYYSLGGSGEVIWEMLAEGSSVERMVDRLVSRYEVSPEAARDTVTRLVAELERDGLLETCEDASVAADPPTADSGARAPWEAPVFERFTDLQSLLLLDPIHDVDAAGWPHQQRDDQGP